MNSKKHLLCAGIVGLLQGSVSVAQAPVSQEHQGLTGSIVMGSSRFTLDDGARSGFVGGVNVGYRIRLGSVGESTVSLTPQFGLLVNKFRGIKLNSAQVGFSRADILGGQLAIHVGPVRPYVIAHRSLVTVERYVGSELTNYYGHSPSYGIGLEIPLENACDAGFDIGVRSSSGVFDTLETRSKVYPPRGGKVRSTTITVGWTGRFRGNQWLFKCR